MPDRNITDYPEIFVDGKCFHIIPLDGEGFVLIKPNENPLWWESEGPYIDTYINKSAPIPKKIELEE